MNLAETANLAVNLSLTGNFASGIATAEKNLTGFGAKATSGLSSFGSKLKGIVTGPLSLLNIGLAGSAYKVEQFFTGAIGKAQQFGLATEALQKITNLDVETTSRLVDALDFFGITAETQIRVAGLYEKNLHRVADTSEKAAAFEKTYGLRITDSKGKLLDYNKQLLVSADYFNNKSIPAQQKSAALAALYGRSWQELIPILLQGSAGINKATADAMHLSQAQLDAITKNKMATRAWDDAISDLQTEIGVDLLPTITDLATTMTNFVSQHGEQIRAFFRDGLGAIRGAVGGAAEVVGAIKTAWDALPGPVKDILIKGVVAERTVKFLFGFGVTDIAGALLKGLGGVGGGFFGRGSPVNPMWVRQVGGLPGGGGPGGGPGLLAGAGLLAGLGGIFATAVGGIQTIEDILNSKTPDSAVRAAMPIAEGPNGMIAKAITSLIGDPIGDYLKSIGINFGPKPSAPSVVSVANVPKVDLSETDRRMFQSQDEDRRAWNQRHLRAADTTAERIGVLHSQLQTSNSELSKIAAKREENRITTNLRIPITVNNYGHGSEAGSTVRKAVVRQGSVVLAGQLGIS